MSPVAVEIAQDLPMAPGSTEHRKQSNGSSPGLTLVIGSPSTAQDGTYPDLISELKNDSAHASGVEKQMVDRILDGGMLLTPQLARRRKARALIKVSRT